MPIASRIYQNLSRVSSTTLENSHIVATSTATVYRVLGYNSGPAQFIQLHDSATVPANTAVPIYTIAVPTLSNFIIELYTFGDTFNNGIVVCNSTTSSTKTIGAADCFFNCRYELVG